METTCSPRLAATAVLGEEVGAWIDRHRNSPAQLSYRQIAAILAAECGVAVTGEALRQWHSAHLESHAA